MYCYTYNQGCHMVRKSQEKLIKMTKVRKSQVKIGVFEKSQVKMEVFENSQKKFFFKHQIFSIRIYQISYI